MESVSKKQRGHTDSLLDQDGSWSASYTEPEFEMETSSYVPMYSEVDSRPK